MEETPKDKVQNLEDHAVLEEFEDVYASVKDSLQNEYTRVEGVANTS